MFKRLKNWWTTPAKHPKALAIGGFSVAAAGVYLLIRLTKNA